MTGLQKVPCHFAVMGSETIFSSNKTMPHCLAARENCFHSLSIVYDMGVKDFIHIALACKCALDYNQVGTATYTK